MANKLEPGDAFPAMKFKMIDGGILELPNKSGDNYQVVLFYRGAF
jgi:peroxiredoxin